VANLSYCPPLNYVRLDLQGCVWTACANAVRRAVHVPVAGLPLRFGGKHTPSLATLGIDRDHAWDVDPQALHHGPARATSVFAGRIAA
jgi:hypothetical protein